MTKAHNKITEIQTLQILQTDTNFYQNKWKKLKQKRKLEKWKAVQNMNKNIIWIIIYK